MKPKDKENLIRTIPLIVLVVITVNITSMLGVGFPARIGYFALSGVIGALIGHFLLKFMKKRRRNEK